MKKLIMVFTLVAFSTATLAGHEATKTDASDQRSTIFESAYKNLQELTPFLFTTAISVLTGKLQPKEAELNGNPALAFMLQNAAVVIPVAVAVANAYSRVATIRDTRRNFAESDTANQDALTRQQDEIVANYIVTVPASIAAAVRLATSDDAAARIGYIVGSFMIASGENSPLSHVKNWVASLLDQARLKKVR